MNMDDLNNQINTPSDLENIYLITKEVLKNINMPNDIEINIEKHPIYLILQRDTGRITKK